MGFSIPQALGKNRSSEGERRMAIVVVPEGCANLQSVQIKNLIKHTLVYVHIDISVFTYVPVKDLERS